MGSDSSPTRVRRPDGAGAVNAAVPDDQDPRPPAWPAAARVGPSEHQSCDRPRVGAARDPPPTRLERPTADQPAVLSRPPRFDDSTPSSTATTPPRLRSRAPRLGPVCARPFFPSPGLAGQRNRAWPAPARADGRWGEDGHEAAAGDVARALVMAKRRTAGCPRVGVVPATGRDPGTVCPGPTWCKRASPMFWCDKGHSNPMALRSSGVRVWSRLGLPVPQISLAGLVNHPNSSRSSKAKAMATSWV